MRNLTDTSSVLKTGRRTRREIVAAVRTSVFVQVMLGTFFATVFALRVVGQVNQAVLLWPVSAVGLGLSLPAWHVGTKKRILLLLSVAAGFLIAATIIGMPWRIASLVVTLTCLDVLISASILSPAVKRFDDLRHQSNILRFLAAATLASIFTGIVGAYPIAVFLGQPWLETIQTNALGVSLGFAVVTPAVLFITDRRVLSLAKLAPDAMKSAGCALLLLAVCSFVFWQTTGPLLFLIFPPMIALLLLTGLEGAVFASISLTGIGWLGTMHGHGPILLMHGSALDHLKLLQVFAWVSAAAALPIGALRDERKRAEEHADQVLHEKSEVALELAASRHLFQSFNENSPNLTFIKDSAGRYVFYNQAFAALFGIDRTVWMGRTDWEIFPSAAAERFRANDLQVVTTGKSLEVVEKVAGADGVLRSFKTIKFAYEDVRGETLLAGVAVDISVQVAYEEQITVANAQLELLARTDSLTGMPNRRTFEARAEIEFSIARRKRRPLSMLLMDVDNFKRRNDVYGHSAGDEALKVLGAVLIGCVRIGDMAARLGGEEFGFLLPETDADGALILAERIQAALRVAEHGPVPLTVSVGVATLDPSTVTWEHLLLKADDAMYEAKRTGKNKSVYHRALMPQLDSETGRPVSH